ncbi:hypothetical protein IBX35_00540 [Candidatus Bathyarchaeota archaeon]|nr:hypothetical protein [Candidatus Bathyarchaeota archaeon]
MLSSLVRLMFLTILSVGARESWWEMIPKGLRLVFSLAVFFVSLFVLAVVLYLAGLVVVGRKRALLTDAFIISFLGTILSTLFFMFISYHWVALVLSIVVWLLLVKRLYETGWLGATAVGILAIIIFLAVTVLLALLFGILYVIFELIL